MTLLVAILVGIMHAAGLYLLMRRSVVKLVIGLMLFSNATLLLMFTAAGLRRRGTPIVPAGESLSPDMVADPLPQALLLTAIVINFGILAFAIVLVHAVHHITGSDDIDDLTVTE